MSETVIRPSRLFALLVLVVAAVALAVPLALMLLDIAASADRRLLVPSGGMVWAAMMLALLVSFAVALAAWPSRGLRRGAVLGTVSASLVATSALAWQATGPATPAVPSCAAQPQVGRLTAVRAATYVDGVQRDALGGRMYGPAGAGVAALFDELPLAASEDLGIERLEVGDQAVVARHCRALVSGSQVTGAVPEVADGSLATDAPLVPAELPVWRGDFDWWVSAEGELARASFSVGGHPFDAWQLRKLRGRLEVELWPAWMVGQ